MRAVQDSPATLLKRGADNWKVIVRRTPEGKSGKGVKCKHKLPHQGNSVIGLSATSAV